MGNDWKRNAINELSKKFEWILEEMVSLMGIFGKSQISGRFLRGVFLATVILLFLLPSFWFPSDVFDIGGDDSRMYLAYPGEWLKNISLYSWTSGLASYSGQNNPQQFYLPINLLALGFKTVFPFFNHQFLIYGLVLSLSFAAIFFLIREMTHQERGWERDVASYIGGLMYLAIPVVYFFNWRNPLASLFGLAAYPLILLFFLRAINRRNQWDLAWGCLVSVLFSVSLIQVPYLLPTLLGFIFFLGLYFFFGGIDKKLFLKYGIFFGLLVLILNSFWLIPYGYSVVGGNRDRVLNEEGRLEAVSMAGRLTNEVSLVRSLAGFSGYIKSGTDLFSTRLEKLILVAGFFSFLIIIFSFLIRARAKDKSRKALVFSFIPLLLMIFLITVNIGSIGEDIFEKMIFHLPLFVAMRNFWSKTSVPLGIFFALSFGLALFIIGQYLKKTNIKISIFILGFGLVVILGWPFFTGQLARLPILYPQEKASLGREIKFENSFLEIMDYLNVDQRGGRVLSFPLVEGSWSIVPSLETKGVYIGLSPIKVLTGRDNLNSQFSMRSKEGELDTKVGDLISLGEDDKLRRLFSLMGVEYILVNTDFNLKNDFDLDLIREKFVWIDPIDKQQYGILKERWPVRLVKKSGQWELYQFNDKEVLPIIFTPNIFRLGKIDLKDTINLPLTDRGYSLPSWILTESAEGFEVKNKWPMETIVPLQGYDFKAGESRLDVEMAELQARYPNREIGRKGHFRAEFEESGSYKILAKKGGIFEDPKNLRITIDGKPIELGEGDEDGVWRELCQHYFPKGTSQLKLYQDGQLVNVAEFGDLIFSLRENDRLPDMPEVEIEKINPVRYRVKVNAVRESFPLVLQETYNSGWRIYMADDSPGTLGKISGGLVDLNKEPAVFSDNHFRANGFQNGWWIDLESLVNECKISVNENGEYDLEMVIEFWPQRLFYLGLLISLVGLLLIIIRGVNLGLTRSHGPTIK